MAKGNTVLLVDDSEQRQAQMNSLFTFLGKSTVRSNVADALTAVEDPNDLLCLVLTTQAPASLLEAIAKWSSHLPIVLIGAGSIPDQNLPINRQIIATIDEQVSYAALNSVLHQCENCRQIQFKTQREHLLASKMEGFVGQSKGILAIRKLVAQVAATDSNVLLTGESGTGKEVVASNLHRLSERRDAPFIPINCGAIPGELLESELFGHEKGAFTGAITARQGRFELARGGTLFLDEIGDMPLAMQVKLLRVLQERTFERVGSNKTLQADVRIITATHRDLEALVEEGKFREDLYYRLNVFPIELPPLRERAEDLPLLINELVRRFEEQGDGSVRLNESALASLAQHGWPGNIRELGNLIERLIILHPFSVVGLDELPKKYRYAVAEDSTPSHELAEPIPLSPLAAAPQNGLSITDDNFDLKEHLIQMEVSFIRDALEKSNWVVARAASLLSMRRTTLVEKMRKHGLSKSTSSLSD